MNESPQVPQNMDIRRYGGWWVPHDARCRKRWAFVGTGAAYVRIKFLKILKDIDLHWDAEDDNYLM